ncbi:MAG: tape measure protein, partial [Ruminococcus sp.]|nr:tape measure protein [Ruminococcus sp.]
MEGDSEAMSSNSTGGRVVEQKVVEMRFDNKQFESGVEKSINTVQRLKDSLNFQKSADSLKSIEKAASKVDISPLGKAAENISLKFSALEVAAMTAISRITNAAMDAGKKITEALVIKPVKMGFEEYETQINAVQTILANTESKGSTLEDVNAALDELNKYADMTIYNFTEMTKNIGTFTAAGVDLETSVAAIKGIANLAAVSGSTSQQAATAMYQLSQALAAGSLKLQDWNSVVNAGMGGQVFQDALKETARVHGIAIDEMIEKEGSFRETLKSGWITSELLTETLAKFTGDLSKEQLLNIGYTEEQAAAILKMGQTANDAATKVKTFSQLIDTLGEAMQSGWTQSWEIIIGDFEEAKELFTEVSNVLGGIIEESANFRNALLADTMQSSWSKLVSKLDEAGVSAENFQNEVIAAAKANGKNTDEMLKMAGSFESALQKHMFSSEEMRTALTRLSGVTNEAGEAVEDVSEKFRGLDDISNKVILGNFGNGAERMRRLTELGYEYSEVQDIVNRKLKGEIFSVESLSAAQEDNAQYTDEQIAKLKELGDCDEDIEALIKSMSKPSGRELLIDSFRNALQGLIGVMETVKEAWSEVFPPLTAETLYGIIEKVHELSKKFKMTEEKADKLKRTFKGVFSILDVIARTVRTVVTFAFEGLKNLLGLTGVDILEMTASLGDMLTGFREWVTENDVITESINKLVKYFNTGIGIIKEWFKEFTETPSVVKFFNAVENAAESFSDGVKKNFGNTINYIKDLIDRFKELKYIDLEDIKNAFITLGNDIKTCFENMAESESPAESLFDKIGGTVKGWAAKVKETFVNVKNFISGFVIYLKEHLSIASIATVLLGADLMVMAAVLYDCFKNFATLGDTLTGPIKKFSRVLTAISKGINTITKAEALKIAAGAIQQLAISVVILTGSLAVLTMLDQSKLWGAFGALAALSGVVVALSVATALLAKKLELGKSVSRATNSVVNMAAGVFMLAAAAKLFENIEWGAFGKAALAVAVFTAELAGGNILLAKFAPELSKNSWALLATAASVLVLVAALKQIADMEPGSFDGKIGI